MGVSAGLGAEVRSNADGEVPDARHDRRGLVAAWAFAVLTAGLGTAIVYDAQPGINYGLWTTLAGGGLWWVGRRRARAAGMRGADPVAQWMVGLACLAAWGAALTADETMQLLIVVAAVVLLATATRILAGLGGKSVGAKALVTAPPLAFARTTVEAGRRLAALVTATRGERQAAWVRGFAIAVPVASVFALILAGADPTLTAWRRAVWEALTASDLIPRLVFFFGLGTITLGACGLALRAALPGQPAAPPLSVPLGPTERRVTVGAVGGVFGAFLLVQASELFRDTHALRISGMTYAEYAHEGFVELTFAATLAVLLVLALDRYARLADRRHGMPGWRRQWGTLLLIAEVLVVLASAHHRLVLYEAAYGHTLLRLHVEVYLAGVGVTLAVLAVEVCELSGAFDGRRVVRRSGLVAMVLLTALCFGNPEAWVVRHNLARMHETGRLDASYLASLSLNAGPALVEALGSLPPACSDSLRHDLDVAIGWHLTAKREDRWYEWNLRRSAGLEALRAAGVRAPIKPEDWLARSCDTTLTAGRR